MRERAQAGKGLERLEMERTRKEAENRGGGGGEGGEETTVRRTGSILGAVPRM